MQENITAIDTEVLEDTKVFLNELQTDYCVLTMNTFPVE